MEAWSEIAGLPPSDEPGADSLFSPINSAHADFLAAAGYGPETGLPGGMNPKPGAPATPGAPPQAGVAPPADANP